LVVKPEGMRPFGRPGRRWDIKMDLVNVHDWRARAGLIWIRIGDYG
jgi:hypothetical protein